MENFTHRDQLPSILCDMGLTNKGAEVGTFRGQFSKTILESWPGKLYMVDVWRPLDISEYDDSSNHAKHSDAYSSAMSSISGFEDRAFMLRMKGDDAASLFQDESLDFVYIDANHTYDAVKKDILKWHPKVRKGGLLLGHDYLPSHMYSAGQKDIPIYLFPDDQPENAEYAGMFGVNPAVDEFCEKEGYSLNRTGEWLGTWWIKKK
jgi:hypothetical protein